MAELTLRSELTRPLTSAEADGNITELASRILAAVNSQDNVTKVINRIWPADAAAINLAAVSLYIQDNISFVVSPTDTPVLFRFYYFGEGFAYTYIFDFGGGKGTWGPGGDVVDVNMLTLVAVYQTSLNEVEDAPNTTTIDLGEILPADFIAEANSETRPLNNEEFAYYFIYTTDGVEYSMRFVGAPGVYGAGGTALTESDFVAGPTSETEPGAVPSLDQVATAGNEAPLPLVVVRNDGNGKLRHEGNKIAYQPTVGAPVEIVFGTDDIYILKNGIKYSLPSKVADDVLGMMSDVSLKVNIAAASATGSAVTFLEDSVYGSPSSPITGNITGNVTGAKLGVTNIMIHNSGTAPTFDSKFKKYNTSLDYQPGVNNYIYMTYINSTTITYSIRQLA